MKLTLLDIVQRTLSAIDSNNVSSVSDSVESEQITLIVQRVYDDILALREWDFLNKEGQLDPQGLVTPTYMEAPEEAITLHRIKYKKKDVSYIHPNDFRDMLDSRDDSLDTVISGGFYNDRDPRYWTSFDDNTIVFDAYNIIEGNTLLQSESYVYYTYCGTTLIDDTDIPGLPVRFHNILLNGVIGRAMEELKGDSTAAREYTSEYKRGISRMQKYGRLVESAKPTYRGDQDYGRKGS